MSCPGEYIKDIKEKLSKKEKEEDPGERAIRLVWEGIIQDEKDEEARKKI